MTNKEAIGQLKWVQKRICDITYSPESFEALNLAIKALENERPQGGWLVVGHDNTTYWYRCSICGHEEHDNFTKHYHYCPNCGAEMKGDTSNA